MLTPFGRARRSQKQNLVCVEVSVRAFVVPLLPRCAWSLYSLLECARLRTGCLPNCVTLVRGRGLTPRRTLVCSFSMGALGVAWRMRTPRHTRPINKHPPATTPHDCLLFGVGDLWSW